MEKAKLNLMIAYAADSLFYMFLKTQVGARSRLRCPPRHLEFLLVLLTAHLNSPSLDSRPLSPAAFKSWHATDKLIPCHLQGAATEEHPVTEELTRIKTYMGKLKQLGEGAAKDQQRLKERSHWPRAPACHRKCKRPRIDTCLLPAALRPLPPLFWPARARTQTAEPRRRHAQVFGQKQVNKEAAQRFIAAGLGGGGGGEGSERECNKEKREKPDLEDSGKKRKKKST